MNALTIAALEERMHAAGEGWAIAHAQRLLKLIEQIGAGLEYDHQALTWAAYLHDWGAFQVYYQPGCDHAEISWRIAQTEILPQVDLPEKCKGVILEAIEKHDYQDRRPLESIEALLLREADCLEFLGAIGFARELARSANDLDSACARIVARKNLIRERFTLPEARRIAAQRLARMEVILEDLQEESFGIL